MNFRAISAWKPAGLPVAHNSNEPSGVQPFGSAVSRRAFVRTVAGTAAVGTAAGSDGFESDVPRRTAFPWSFAPVPIPKGTPGLGGFYHVFGPGTSPDSDPVDAEPASITNFKGFVGLAYLSGNVTQTNLRTGRQDLLPFVDSDMRFMSGTFLGTDGKEHQASFAFV